MENIVDILLDSLIDALKDSFWVIVFLFITYLVMEYIEHRFSKASQNTIQKAGRAGPFIGALLGIIPQCGFSAAASAFYAGRVITVGTLIAVYLSTSDEMLPVLIAGHANITTIAFLLIMKFCIGMIFGFIIDACLWGRNKQTPELQIHQLCKDAKCNCSGHCEECKQNPSSVYGHHEEDSRHKHDHSGSSIILSAAKHTIQVGIFIIVITFILNIIVAFCGGEESLAKIANINPILTVLVTGLVGLIPNCAASVIITQLFVEGLLGLGPTLAGLLSSAGVGILVLIKTNKPRKNSLQIIAVLYLISIICGTITTVISGSL